MEPVYLTHITLEELARRAALAAVHLQNCTLCPWECGVDRRSAAADARCASGAQAVVAAFYAHYGQDEVLSGTQGSGTIYFGGCALRCCFCINASISQGGKGRATSPETLADIMLHLQRQGCHNINLITPTHVIPHILAALCLAIPQGLRLPLVYKSSGFEKVSILRELLDGVIDIYMPDLKYAEAGVAERLSGVPNYPEISQAAAVEMHRQVGDLQVDEQGIAQHGLIVAHLPLPDGLAGSGEIMAFIRDRLSPRTWLNLPTYLPAYQAAGCPPLNRNLRPEEYQQAVGQALEAGLTSAARYRSVENGRDRHDE